VCRVINRGFKGQEGGEDIGQKKEKKTAPNWRRTVHLSRKTKTGIEKNLRVLEDMTQPREKKKAATIIGEGKES